MEYTGLRTCQVVGRGWQTIIMWKTSIKTTNQTLGILGSREHLKQNMMLKQQFFLKPKRQKETETGFKRHIPFGYIDFKISSIDRFQN